MTPLPDETPEDICEQCRIAPEDVARAILGTIPKPEPPDREERPELFYD